MTSPADKLPQVIGIAGETIYPGDLVSVGEDGLLHRAQFPLSEAHRVALPPHLKDVVFDVQPADPDAKVVIKMGPKP